MDNRFYNNLINEMKPFLDENGFVLCEDGSFSCETKALKIEFNDDRQMYIMYLADVNDGKADEYTEVSAWLFDDTQTEKDAETVGIDFTNTLREKMGIKLRRAATAEVDLPSAEKSGALTVSGFTKKVLDVFPQYKNSYKEHIAKYGNFLYLDFFAETLVPETREILKTNTKKSVKKLFDMYENGYVQGDRETVNLIVATVCAAVFGSDEIKKNALEMLESDKHFQNSVIAFIPVFEHKKKLREALLK